MRKLKLKKVKISKLQNVEMRKLQGGSQLNCTDYCHTECKDANCNTEHYACIEDEGGAIIA